MSYSNITLLQALARILGTDVNTLLTFSVTMDPEESRHLYEKLMTTAKDAGWQAAVDLAEAQIAHYPSVTMMHLMNAAFLQTLKAQIPETAWPAVYQQIVAIYQTAEKALICYRHKQRPKVSSTCTSRKKILVLPRSN